MEKVTYAIRVNGKYLSAVTVSAFWDDMDLRATDNLDAALELVEREGAEHLVAVINMMITDDIEPAVVEEITHTTEEG